MRAIIFQDVRTLWIYSMPNVPVDVKINRLNPNQNFDTINQRLRVAGQQGLRTVTWSSFVYGGVRSPNVLGTAMAAVGGRIWVNYINSLNRTPTRVTLINDIIRPAYNGLMTVDNFIFNENAVGDIEYTISMTEFPGRI